VTLNLPGIFILNCVLVIGDAAIGYRLAPLFARIAGAEEDDAERGTAFIRRCLSGVVALYMFCNCLAYFRGETLFILLVTGFVAADIICQLLLGRNLRSSSE
jgi:hypothetical protein